MPLTSNLKEESFLSMNNVTKGTIDILDMCKLEFNGFLTPKALVSAAHCD